MENKNFTEIVKEKIEDGANSVMHAIRSAFKEMTSSTSETLKTVTGIHSMANANERERKRALEDLLVPLKMSPERGTRALEMEIISKGGKEERSIIGMAQKNRNYYNTLQSQYIKIIGLDTIIEATELSSDDRDYNYESVVERLRKNRGVEIYENLISKGYNVSSIAGLVEDGVGEKASKSEIYRMEDLSDYCDRTGILERTR